MDIRKFVESLNAQEKDELLQALSKDRLVGAPKLYVYKFVPVGDLGTDSEENYKKWQERYIAAIKLIRECFGISLREAKSILDCRKMRTFEPNFVVNGKDYRKLLLERGWEMKLETVSEPPY